MATVTKYRGKWRCRVRKTGFPSQSKTFILKADAEAWGRSVEVAMERGTFQEAGTNQPDESGIETVEELLNEYTKKESIKKADKGYADKNRIKPLIEALGKYSIHTLKSKRVSQYKADRLAEKASAQTVTHELNVLHRAYVVAVEEWGLELHGPIPKASRPKLPRGRENRITPGNIELIRKHTDSAELVPIIEFAIDTCMRRQEIVRMEWKDVDLKRKSVYIPRTKTDTPRTIPLTARALEIIKALPGDRDGSVFHMTTWAISRAFQRAVDRAGLGHLVFHETRHEGISRLFEKGLNVIEVSRISGHKTLSQLDRYTHLDVQHLAKKMRGRS